MTRTHQNKIGFGIGTGQSSIYNLQSSIYSVHFRASWTGLIAHIAISRLTLLNELITPTLRGERQILQATSCSKSEGSQSRVNRSHAKVTHSKRHLQSWKLIFWRQCPRMADYSLHSHWRGPLRSQPRLCVSSNMLTHFLNVPKNLLAGLAALLWFRWDWDHWLLPGLDSFIGIGCSHCKVFMHICCLHLWHICDRWNIQQNCAPHSICKFVAGFKQRCQGQKNCDLIVLRLDCEEFPQNWAKIVKIVDCLRPPD